MTVRMISDCFLKNLFLPFIKKMKERCSWLKDRITNHFVLKQYFRFLDSFWEFLTKSSIFWLLIGDHIWIEMLKWGVIQLLTINNLQRNSRFCCPAHILPIFGPRLILDEYGVEKFLKKFSMLFRAEKHDEKKVKHPTSRNIYIIRVITPKFEIHIFHSKISMFLGILFYFLLIVICSHRTFFPLRHLLMSNWVGKTP